MLKKNLLALTLISAGIGGMGLAQADDGVIHFTGTISAAACSVSSVAGSGTTYGTVDLGHVSSKTLNAAGKSSAATPFAIELTDCAVSAAPGITFKGAPITTANYTSLFASSVAGVGIRLEDAGKTGTFYSPNVSGANSGLDALGADVNGASGRFNAYLVAYTTPTEGGAAPTGDIDTDITFVIDYSNS